MGIRIRRLFSELRRRKVYHVAVVYGAVGYGVAEGAGWVFGLLELPQVWEQVAAAIVVLGFPIALVLAWAFEIRPEGSSGGTEPKGNRVGRHGEDRSIAVLPFESLSSDPDGDYFADGITEELTNALARQKGLRVAARTSAFAFKGQRIDVREIGERLNVSHVIEGSVRRSGRALRITAQLIDTADGFHLWSDQFDRKLQIAGLSNPEQTRLKYEDPETGTLAVYHFENDRLRAAETVNRAGDHMSARRLIAADPAPSRADVEAVGGNLRELLKRR